MKILLYTLEYPPQIGGVATYYENLLKTWPSGEPKAVLIEKPGSRFLAYFHYLARLSRTQTHEQANWILVGQILPLGLVAYILSFIFEFKYAVIIHGLDFKNALTGGRKKFITKLILGRAGKIIAANSFVASLIKEAGVADEKIIIANPGIVARPEINQSAVANWQAKLNSEHKIVLLSLGRLVRRKGFDTVIKALTILPTEVLNKIIYIIAGDGEDMAYLKSLTANYPNLASVVKFSGQVDPQDKWNLLQICDIFIMVSRQIANDFEGFGIVYLEANLLAKPVIAGLSGGVGDAVVNELNGLTVGSESIEETATAIIRLLNDQELVERLGRQGQERVLTDFAWSKITAKIYQALKN